MQAVARELRDEVERAAPLLASLEPGEVARRAAPGEWSKKEILGHLIDSAANNHQRFVRACGSGAVEFPAYDQVEWVRIQQYHRSDWATLVALWAAYNRHLCDLVERLPAAALPNHCNVGTGTPVPLEFVVRDYLRHLRHHLQDLLAPPGGPAR